MISTTKSLRTLLVIIGEDEEVLCTFDLQKVGAEVGAAEPTIAHYFIYIYIVQPPPNGQSSRHKDASEMYIVHDYVMYK